LDGIHERDPVAAFGADLLARGIITEEQLESIKAEALQAINDATDAADAATPPDASTMWASVYSE
jgi:TPP-dependent pyruvate/acetoin dehydrogenase alpha subunit